MKKIKIALVGVAVMLAGLFMTTPAMAIKCPDGTRREEADTYAQCNLPPSEETGVSSSLWDTIQNIINWVLAALGLVAVIMIIVGGFNYMTSQGDATKTKKGRDSILYGIIGLLIALLAFAIVNFVLDNVFNKPEPAATPQSSSEHDTSAYYSQ